MKPDKTTLEETAHCHFTPTIIVGITNYKTGKDKEKIDCQLSMIDNLFVVTTSGKRF